MRLGFFLVTVALGAAGACSNDTFNGDDGGGSDTGTDVGPIGGGDAGIPDATSIDAPSEAASVRFCATQDAQFCGDFDDPKDASAGFVGSAPSDSGWSWDFEQAQHVSAPNALQVMFPSTGPGNAGLATITAPAAQATITSDLDVYLPAGLPSTTQPLFAYWFGCAPGPTYTFGIAHESGWKLERGNGSNALTLNVQPPEGDWVHIQTIITLSATSGTVVVLINGQEAGTLPGVVTSPSVSGPWPGWLLVGASSAGTANTSGSFFYDNAVIHLQ